MVVYSKHKMSDIEVYIYLIISNNICLKEFRREGNEHIECIKINNFKNLTTISFRYI